MTSHLPIVDGGDATNALVALTLELGEELFQCDAALGGGRGGCAQQQTGMGTQQFKHGFDHVDKQKRAAS